MNFTELKKSEFESFLKSCPLKTFFQAPEMEEIDSMGGWNTIYVGVKQNEQIVAASRIIWTKVRFNKKIFYAPRGILVDYNDKKLLTFFITNLKNFIKGQCGYTLHIDPPVIYKERDIDGEIVSDGVDNSDIVNTLKSLGFKHDGFTREYDYTKQNRWLFELSVDGKTEDDILKEMNGNTRRSIQRAEHLKVTVRELKRDELHIFKDIMDHTSERREFSDKSMKYYEKMYDLFNDKEEIKYLLAEVNLDETLKVLTEDMNKLLVTKERALKNGKSGLLNETESQINDLNKKIDEIKIVQTKKGNKLYLASAMFMIYGDEVIYYHSGGYKEYMSFFGQYLIQWTMIKEAIKRNKLKYNFYGIKGVFDKKDIDYGVYLFKRGFNGNVVEYIGDFYLPISPYYYIQQIRKRVRK